MIIGIHPDNIWGNSFSEKWISFLTNRGIDVKILNLLANDFLDQVKGCDGVMWRWLHIEQDKQSAKRILYVIEHHLNIPIFPDSSTSWHFDDKMSQFNIIKAISAPVAETWVFWEFEEAVNWAKTAVYPVVFKLSVGAGSSSVVKIESEAKAKTFINRMFKTGIFPMTMNEHRHKIMPGSISDVKMLGRRIIDAANYIAFKDYPPLVPPWWKPEFGYALFQEFLPDNEFDTRVTVIGDRAFAFRRMNRPNDFRASGSGILDTDPRNIDVECISIAFDVSAKCSFQTMAYDFLYKQNRPVICEISYTFVDSAVHSCLGHWDSGLNWHEGHMWPEEAQVEDFITEISNSDVS